MQDFKLPLLDAGTSLEEAFRPMITRGVAGLVVANGAKYQLLHFSQLRAAVDENRQSLNDVSGGIQLEFNALDSDFSADYEIVATPGLGTAIVRSRHEPYSFVYTTTSPGYACSGPNQHTYPPHKRGFGNHCVVPGCPGTI